MSETAHEQAKAADLEAQAKAPPKVLAEAWAVLVEGGKLAEDEDWDVPFLFSSRDEAQLQAECEETRGSPVRVQVVEVPS